MEFLDEPIVEAEKRNSIVIIKPGNLDVENSKLKEINNEDQNLNQDDKSKIGITEINGKLIRFILQTSMLWICNQKIHDKRPFEIMEIRALLMMYKIKKMIMNL